MKKKLTVIVFLSSLLLLNGCDSEPKTVEEFAAQPEKANAQMMSCMQVLFRGAPTPRGTNQKDFEDTCNLADKGLKQFRSKTAEAFETQYSTQSLEQLEKANSDKQCDNSSNWGIRDSIAYQKISIECSEIGSVTRKVKSEIEKAKRKAEFVEKTDLFLKNFNESYDKYSANSFTTLLELMRNYKTEHPTQYCYFPANISKVDFLAKLDKEAHPKEYDVFAFSNRFFDQDVECTALNVVLLEKMVDKDELFLLYKKDLSNIKEAKKLYCGLNNYQFAETKYCTNLEELYKTEFDHQLKEEKVKLLALVDFSGKASTADNMFNRLRKEEKCDIWDPTPRCKVLMTLSSEIYSTSLYKFSNNKK